MTDTGRFASLALGLAMMAGCAGGGDWSKPGADAAETARAYRECAGIADAAVSSEVDIDEDIAATRAADLQRDAIVQTRAQAMQDATRRRDASIVAACMQQKGFAKPR